MKKYQKQLRPALSDVFCDGCGKSCKTPLDDYEYATLYAQWGYSSRKDGATSEMELCEDCFDNVIAHLSTLHPQKRKTNE
jgi:hypothetical protein